ncbi:uncharacterized protein BXZ73DRAFT_101849 [Epithele typhae]|uniref:uncharacterized protein n=1 Tax=Epithele typhae TaxID=378194 RepID=UPI00200792AB|nr:uncharacterized protein BXZ73DRAFT_101849 [Epithele typhae]KAH9930476.1 hypothetical protein BXZ73DRAFT_101849 [Epithele typhae]
MSQIAPDQGRAGLSLPSPINMDWQHPDRDAPRTLYLLVHPPTSLLSTSASASPILLHPPPLTTPLTQHPPGATCTARKDKPDPDAAGDLSEASPDGPWRHIELDTYNVKTDPSPQPRYVFWGPRTLSSSHAPRARPLALGVVAHRQRRALEALAWDTPVMLPDGRWDGQEWVRALLGAAVDAGIVERERVDAAFEAAETVHGQMPPHDE